VALDSGTDVGMPPKSRERDSLAITFLDADLMSSVVNPGFIARPGVVALIGHPFLAGVVPRDSAMLAAASTNDASPGTRELSSVADGEPADGERVDGE
jgi:hypothetical protein